MYLSAAILYVVSQKKDLNFLSPTSFGLNFGYTIFVLFNFYKAEVFLVEFLSWVNYLSIIKFI